MQAPGIKMSATGNNPPRALLVNTLPLEPGYGGAEISGRAIADELGASGWAWAAAHLRPRDGDGILVESRAKAISYSAPIPNVYWPFGDYSPSWWRRQAYHGIDLLNPAAFRSLNRIIKAYCPDLIVCHNLKGWSTSPWLAAWLHGIPLVQVLHDFATVCSRAQQYRASKDCTGRCAGCLPRQASSRLSWRDGILVGVSQDTLSRHQATGVFGTSEAVVWYPPVTVEHRRQDAAAAPRLATQPVYGYLGRLEQNKGIELFLAAAARIGSRVVVGGEGSSQYVGRLRIEYPTAAFLGWVEPGNFFSIIDCLVVPSLWPEPFGRIVVEAAEAGLPVIATRRGGLPEAINIARAHAMTVEATVEALSAAMEAPRLSRFAEPPPSSSTISRAAEMAIGIRGAGRRVLRAKKRGV
jgi:glycosyltransferase involved in cell wall biosynthesis